MDWHGLYVVAIQFPLYMMQTVVIPAVIIGAIICAGGAVLTILNDADDRWKD